ncbi:prophage tail fiber N-terminal domain-containing protein [Escherichia coli]|nr:prophage tail fiber N-terminal domain-containing protein [Escherichia coli]
MAVQISGVLKDGAGSPVAGCTIRLRAKKTSPTVVVEVISSTVTGADGHYSIQAEPGYYSVSLLREGYPPAQAGDIYVTPTDEPDTLNAFLDAPKDGDLRPEVMKRFEEIVNTVIQLSEQVAADRVETTAAAEAARQSEQSSAISAEKSKASEEAAKRSEEEAGLFAQSSKEDAELAKAHAEKAASYRDEAQKFAEQSQKNAAATEQDRLATAESERLAGLYAETSREASATATDAAKEAGQARDDIVIALGDTLKTSRCLGEIADAGEEAQSEALRNLGAGSAARHDVQSGLYDRNAGVARPGAFGFGAEIASSEVISWNWAKEPDGFAIHFSQAMPGRYLVSETNATGSSDGTIPGVVFAGFVEIIWMTSRMQGQTVDKVSKTAVFYGINGGIYASRLAGGKFDKWIKLDKTALESVSPLFSVLMSQTNFSRTPDIGGLIVAAYKKEGATEPFRLNRYDYAKGSELKRVALILPEGEKGLICEVEPENGYNPLPGTYRTLSGHVDVSTNDRFVSLFVRIS